MSSSAARRKKKSGGKSGGRSGSKSGGGHKDQTASRSNKAKRSDLGPYVGFIIIWLAISAGAKLTSPGTTLVVAVSVIAAFSYYITFCTVRAHLGLKLYGWQRGLVRLPLILAGAGNKLVDSVHGKPEAIRAVLIAVFINLITSAATVWVVMTSG